MKVYERARYYIIRKRWKSFLLGCTFMIALLVGLLGMTLLHSVDESLVQIGKQSQAKVTVFTTEVKQQLSEEHIHQLESLNNILFVNRFNELVTYPKNLDISMGNDENLEDAKVKLQGFDDLTLDSLFALGIVLLEEGTLAIEPKDLIVYQSLARLNGLTIGDEISFQNNEGDALTGIIRGVYSYKDPHMENEEYAPSMYRFENLIFAHPEFINQLQGGSSYMEANFYVIDPNIIQETRRDFENIISGTAFETWVSDALFRRMSHSLSQTGNIITMILLITGGATIVVTSLLLTIWSKERKREVALFLSIGESKISIVMQRMLEVFSIYIGAIIVVLILAYFITPNMVTILYQEQINLIEIEQISVSLSMSDIIYVFFLGIFTLTIAIGSSCMSIMRFTPREIFSTID